MRRLVLALSLLLLATPAARAQLGCLEQSQSTLLGQFSDAAPTGSIGPGAVRNVICSGLNILQNLADVASKPLARQNLSALGRATSTADLRTKSTADYPDGIVRTSPAPATTYAPAPAGACTADDGGACVAASGGGFWQAQFQPAGAPATAWGVDPTGATDSTTTMQAAVNALAGTTIPLVITGTPAIGGSGTGITIPPGTIIKMPTWAPPQGSFTSGLGPEIICNNQAAYTCITINNNGTQWYSSGFDNLTIVGTPGSIPVSGFKALTLSAGSSQYFDNLSIRNADTCFEYDGFNFSGYQLEVINPHLTQCLSHPIVLNGVAEVDFFGGRIGDNGDYSYPAGSSFVEFKNDLCTTSGCGPNTVHFFGTHFDSPAGKTPPACAFSWDNWNGNGVIGTTWFKGVFLEENNTSPKPMFCSDATVPALPQLWVDNSSFQIDGASGPYELFSFNSVTGVHTLNLSDTACGTGCNITLNQSPVSGNRGVNDVHIADVENVYNVSLTANGTVNTLWFRNTRINTSLTIAGAWSTNSQLYISGLQGSYSVSDSATGTVCYDESSVPQSWTPALTFGGASTGWTFTVSGTYWRTQTCGFKATYNILETAQGSAAGNLNITGLPLQCSSALSDPIPTNNSSVNVLVSNLPVSIINTGTPTPIAVRTWNSGSHSYATLTDGAFEASPATHLIGTAMCLTTN